MSTLLTPIGLMGNMSAHYLFYDQLQPAIVQENIRQGHAAVNRITGKPSIGFRTPHFGSFQNPSHLKLLYQELRSLGYRFSTSTVP